MTAPKLTRPLRGGERPNPLPEPPPPPEPPGYTLITSPDGAFENWFECVVLPVLLVAAFVSGLIIGATVL